MASKSKNTKNTRDEGQTKKPLQFLVDESFHREFKALAANRGIKMCDLFKEIYEFYKDAKG